MWSFQNDAKTTEKMTETLAHGTHLRVLIERHPMNTNMRVNSSYCPIGFKYMYVLSPLLTSVSAPVVKIIFFE